MKVTDNQENGTYATTSAVKPKVSIRPEYVRIPIKLNRTVRRANLSTHSNIINREINVRRTPAIPHMELDDRGVYKLPRYKNSISAKNKGQFYVSPAETKFAIRRGEMPKQCKESVDYKQNIKQTRISTVDRLNARKLNFGVSYSPAADIKKNTFKKKESEPGPQPATDLSIPKPVLRRTPIKSFAGAYNMKRNVPRFSEVSVVMLNEMRKKQNAIKKHGLGFGSTHTSAYNSQESNVGISPRLSFDEAVANARRPDPSIQFKSESKLSEYPRVVPVRKPPLNLEKVYHSISSPGELASMQHANWNKMRMTQLEMVKKNAVNSAWTLEQNRVKMAKMLESKTNLGKAEEKPESDKKSIFNMKTVPRKFISPFQPPPVERPPRGRPIPPPRLSYADTKRKYSNYKPTTNKSVF